MSQIPYNQIGFLNRLVTDLVNNDVKVQPFIKFSSDINGVKEAIKKRSAFSVDRSLLSKVLIDQYKCIENVSDAVLSNITSLKAKSTFTVVTGHQLNLLSGPAYFVYKIVSTINLAKQIELEEPGVKVVPVFWMASEDHDYQEVNHTYIRNEKYALERQQEGAVGKHSLEGIEEVFENIIEKWGEKTGSEWIHEFKEVYATSKTYSGATFRLVNKLFGEYGVVVVDGDNKLLKEAFQLIMEKELFDRTNAENITTLTTQLLSQGYHKQVHHREVNLFYMIDGLRERIVFEDGAYKVNNSDLTFSVDSLKKELEKFPERFSPNAVLRPVYQETILPNLVYVGGAGELSYWLQLKHYFEGYKVFFPVLMLRNSVVYLDKGVQKRLDKVPLENKDFFAKHDEVVNTYVNSCIEPQDISPDTHQLEEVFQVMEKKIVERYASLKVPLEAERKKLKKQLEGIEKRVKKAEKVNNEVRIQQVSRIHNGFFPEGKFQERYWNILSILLFNPNYIDELQSLLQPFAKGIDVVLES